MRERESLRVIRRSHFGSPWAPRQRLRARYFDWDTGRVAVRELARRHIVERYFAKSERCRDCSVSAKCDGLHINMIRDQGLSLAAPITRAAADAVDWVLPPQLRRLESGRKPESAAVSLPGYEQPTVVIEDPLAVIAREKEQRQRERRRERRIRLGLPLKPEDLKPSSPSH